MTKRQYFEGVLDALATFLSFKLIIFEVHLLFISKVDLLWLWSLLSFLELPSFPVLFLLNSISAAVKFASADEILEDHVIFCQGASLISEDVLDLTQVFIDRSVVGSAEEIILL